ncbi:COG1943 Transposase and inactivated derivatives [Fimbriimonadaceae bacterium]
MVRNAHGIFHTWKKEISMPTTHSSLHVHVIFSTKERAPLLTTDLIDDAHAYIGGILRELDCKPVAVGGVADHVHILVGTKPVHRLSDVMRETKKVSSIWMNARCRGFAWQEGYGAFAVSNHEVPMMMQYVSHQAEHHKSKSFLEEMEQVYRLAGVSFYPSEFE